MNGKGGRVWLRLIVGFALAAAGLSTGPTASAAPASPLCGASGSGSSTRQTTDGATHTYFYRIPNTPAPAGGRPVLIWMHGDGGTGAPPTGSEWYPYTDHDGAIVITPTGAFNPDAGYNTWTHAAADLAGQPQDSQFLMLILDELDTCSTIDHAKYFVGGGSRGAYMPYYLMRRDSTLNRIDGVAINAGHLYCQAGDNLCVASSSATLDKSAARMIHVHGTNDEYVPAPTATFHDPIDWNVDWDVFWPMKFWAQQHSCFSGGSPPGDNGVLKETYTANGRTARVYDLTGHGAACAKYQLILVDNGGHVIANQESRIWNFLMGPSVAVYRFWSARFNNAHFYTAGQGEADHVRESDSNWAYEGVAFRAFPFAAGSCSTGSPVFRFFSSTFGSHFYTSSSVEADQLKTSDHNWNYEGVAYCAFAGAATGRIALYRFWSPVYGKHFYTANPTEASNLTHDPAWNAEGIAYYVLP